MPGSPPRASPVSQICAAPPPPDRPTGPGHRGREGTATLATPRSRTGSRATCSAPGCLWSACRPGSQPSQRGSPGSKSSVSKPGGFSLPRRTLVPWGFWLVAGKAHGKRLARSADWPYGLHIPDGDPPVLKEEVDTGQGTPTSSRSFISFSVPRPRLEGACAFRVASGAAHAATQAVSKADLRRNPFRHLTHMVTEDTLSLGIGALGMPGGARDVCACTCVRQPRYHRRAARASLCRR